MGIDKLLHSDLWQEFNSYARSRRKDPVEILATLIEEHLVEVCGVPNPQDEDAADVRAASRARAEAVRKGVVVWEELKEEQRL